MPTCAALKTEAARVPNVDSESIFEPSRVVWHYYGAIVDALKALLKLPEPGHENAPHMVYAPPKNGLIVTADERQVMGVRFPTRTRVGQYDERR